MTITAAEIAGVLDEFRARVLGAVVRQVLCIDDTSFALELRTPGENHLLLLDLAPDLARLHLVERKPRQAPQPADFVQLLRNHLPGLRLRDIFQLGQDRIAILEFEHPDRGRRVLVAELTGRRANAFLVQSRGGPEGSILGALRADRTSRRLRPGAPYRMPEGPAAREGEKARTDRLQLAELPADGSRSRRLVAFFEERRAVLAESVVRRTFFRRLRSALKAMRRRQAAVTSDLERAIEAEEYRRFGELLQSAHGRVPRGATAAEVPDFYVEGTPPVTVPLLPQLDLRANITRYFRLYKKYHGAVDEIRQRLDRTRANVAQLEDALHAAEETAEQAPRPDGSPSVTRQCWHELERQLESRGVLRPRPAEVAPGGRHRDRPPVPYREFQSRGGKPILVGRGGKHNDALTLRVARGNDLWMHARDWTGAHVVVRLDRGEEIDEETLLDAATLAAHHSKARGAAKVDVAYTHVKHVRKPKGSPPGTVTYAKAKTITLRVEKERLDRLLGKEWG